VLIGAAFATGVAVFDDGVALPLHHLGKPQGFAGKGAVAICSNVLRVKDADEVQAWLHSVAGDAMVLG